MAELFASVAGNRVTDVTARFPFSGCWTCDLDLHEAVDLTGPVEVVLGTMVLKGTIHPDFSGKFVGSAKVRVVAGKNGWSTRLKAKDYTDDLGVKRSTVIQDAARECGETVTITGDLGRMVGFKFDRHQAPASRTMELALKGTGYSWFLDSNGVTQVAVRSTSEITAAYDLIDFDPRRKVATVAITDPVGIVVGSILRDEKLAKPLQARELEVTIAGAAMRLMVWGKELAS